MWTYIIAGLIALSALATITVEVKSYLNGVKESGVVQERAVWTAAAEKRRQEEALASANAAKGLASDRATANGQVKTRSVYVDKIIEKPIYTNICLDATGLSCVNATFGRKGATGCKPSSTVSGNSLTLRWDRSFGVEEVN